MSYAAITDMMARYDVRVLGDLVSDTGIRVTNLIGNVVLQAMLDGAAGEIDMAVLVGERYTIAQLNGLTGVDQQVLFDLNCNLAFKRLRLRRGMPLEGFPQIADAERMCEELRLGTRVFASLPQEQAGVPVDMFLTPQQYIQLNLLRDRATVGFFTPRRIQNNIGL